MPSPTSASLLRLLSTGLLLASVAGCELLISEPPESSADASSEVDANQPDPGNDAGGADAGSQDAGQPGKDASNPPVDAGPVDAGQPLDAGSPDAGNADAGAPADAGSPVDGGLPPLAPCRSMALACLDSADPNVLEVPTKVSAATAFSTATANQVIQVNGATLTGTGWLPAYVTLRGCNGAKIGGSIAFKGSGGTVEGFEIPGSLVANQTGSYVVRYNRFVAPTTGTDPGLSARSVDALVGARVTINVDSNWFEGRRIGLELATSYDTLVHEVTATVRNNVFVRNTQDGLSISESGLVGKITPTIEQNTFVDCATGISLWGLDQAVTLTGNLFSGGTHAVTSNGAFNAYYCLAAGTTGAVCSGTLLSGTFATAPDARFNDPANGDYRLALDSPAIDRIPWGTPMSSPDYYGCPRPQAPLGGSASGDIGAIETQP